MVKVNNEKGGGGGIPGFEMVTLIVALGAAMWVKEESKGKERRKPSLFSVPLLFLTVHPCDRSPEILFCPLFRHMQMTA